MTKLSQQASFSFVYLSMDAYTRLMEQKGRLTPREYLAVVAHIDGVPLVVIAARNQTSRQSISAALRRGLRKLRA